MSGAIVDLSRQPPPQDLSVEVCIVGSGCGGGTAARLLAEAGLEVVVLEEGRDLPRSERNQRDGDMYDQLYMDRGGRASDDLSVTVLQGRALGGGGVINACDVVPVPDGVLQHWHDAYGLGDFAPEKMAPYKAEALTDLSATQIPEGLINKANGLLRKGTEAMGYRGEVMLHNRVGCQGLGTCLISCPVEAKRNPRMVAIPAAVRAGARFFTRARATDVGRANADLKELTVRTLDPGGYREVGEFRVRAKVVILAANAIASAQLLLRSGIGNPHVGNNLMLQPQLPIIAFFDDRVAAFDGVPQSYAVTEFEQEDHPEHGLWGFRIEGIMGTPGIVSTLLPFTGVESMRRMSQYDRMAASLLLVPDRPSGQVRVSRQGRLKISYQQRADHQQRLRRAVEEAAKIYFAAGAKEVAVPTTPPVLLRAAQEFRADRLPMRPASAPLISAHQQGTVRFANSANDGGANPDGLVYGTRDVYVFDSSGFPSSASSHTMAPIIATSRYLSARLIARMR